MPRRNPRQLRWQRYNGTQIIRTPLESRCGQLPAPMEQNPESECHAVHLLTNQGRALTSVFLCLATLLFTPWAQAQSTDEVHVVPRNESGHATPAPILEPPGSDSALNAHSRPLRADVDLVLIPATVTDAKNRPVIDLQKQNLPYTRKTSRRKSAIS